MGKKNKFKSFMGFGADWDKEKLPLEELMSDDFSDAADYEDREPEVDFPDTMAQSPSITMAPGTGSPEAYAEGAQSSQLSYESPYASGAAPSAVIKHARRPDLQRASEASGKIIRDVQDTAPGLQVQQMDGVYRIRPKHFSEAHIVADHFRSGSPVSMDLTLTSIKQRQRFVDFAAGLVYALDGQLTRSSNHVYLLTPRDY